MESLDFIQAILDRMLRFFLVGFPALLLIFGFAGSWLSARSLKPIVDITRTASTINENDLSSRIRYRGSTSEISSLAASFDRMLDRLQAAFNRERRFTSDAAHELRTPLTAIRGQLEVALRRTRTPKEYRKTLRNLQQYVARLIRLSGDLLYMCRMEGIPAGQNPVLISLSDLLEAVADQVSPILRAKRLSLTLHHKQAAIVRGDMDQLIRLFLNLMDNATKYASEDGSIVVEVGRNHDGIRVSFSNTGPGIPKEEIPFIFDRFYRVQTDCSRQSGGAGLGLSIAQEIARRHGGKITAESKPNLPTTFTVLLPCYPGNSD